MHKSAMAKLVESLVERVVRNSQGTIDPLGARALLGAALRRNADTLVADALPERAAVGGPGLDHSRHASSVA